MIIIIIINNNDDNKCVLCCLTMWLHNNLHSSRLSNNQAANKIKTKVWWLEKEKLEE